MRIESFVEPVEINGKTFEKADVPAAFAAVKNLVQQAFEKPKETKKSAAKFLKTCMELDLVPFESNLMHFCDTILK